MTDPETEKRLNSLEKKIEQLQEEIRQKEMTQLRWGLYVLGAVVMAMGTWIWAQVEPLVHLRLGK